MKMLLTTAAAVVEVMMNIVTDMVGVMSQAPNLKATILSRSTVQCKVKQITR